MKDFVCEPHAAVCCDERGGDVLNLVAREAGVTRTITTELAREKPLALLQEVARLKTLALPAHHHVSLAEINPARLSSVLISTYERQPQNFEQLLGIAGVGPASLRALALIGEVIYGAEPSWRDPARFSFAHGGKDGHPYPVDRANYDRSIAVLRAAVRRSRAGYADQKEALQRLDRFEQEPDALPPAPEYATTRIRETRGGEMAIQGRLPF